jgi:hypothetical protein
MKNRIVLLLVVSLLTALPCLGFDEPALDEPAFDEAAEVSDAAAFEAPDLPEEELAAEPPQGGGPLHWNGQPCKGKDGLGSYKGFLKQCPTPFGSLGWQCLRKKTSSCKG